tara:strand:- start:175 stop:276 length:102 start_codon:yes stop_codon:yes gene_type:complete
MSKQGQIARRLGDWGDWVDWEIGRLGDWGDWVD